MHTTVMHWVSDVDEEWLCGVLRELPRNTPIVLESDLSELFGRNVDVPVYTLRHNAILTELHNRLLTLLKEKGVGFAEPQWVGIGYRPHVATVDGRMFASGSIHESTSIVLVRREEDKNKTIVASYPPLTQK